MKALKVTQWITIVAAVCAGVGAELTNLGQVLSPHAIVWVLIVTNIVSSVLPSVVSALNQNNG